MPRDLFNAATAPAARTRAFSRYTVIGSALLHLGVVAVVLIVPLFAEDVLPKLDTGRLKYIDATVVIPSPPVTPPAAVRVTDAFNRNAAPIVPPDKIRDEQPAPDPAANYAEHGLPISDGPIGPVGVLSDKAGAPSPVPTPPPQAAPAPQKPFHVGGTIREPVKIRNVAPVYPQIAQSARVEGRVIIEAIIGTDGAVQQARVLSGSPLLNDAALDAVKQWRYQPTLLNNQPVAVIMTVTVNFVLNH